MSKIHHFSLYRIPNKDPHISTIQQSIFKHFYPAISPHPNIWRTNNPGSTFYSSVIKANQVRRNKQQACHATLINLLKRIRSLNLEILHLRFSCVLYCHINQVGQQTCPQGQVRKETLVANLVVQLLDI